MFKVNEYNNTNSLLCIFLFVLFIHFPSGISQVLRENFAHNSITLFWGEIVSVILLALALVGLILLCAYLQGNFTVTINKSSYVDHMKFCNKISYLGCRSEKFKMIYQSIIIKKGQLNSNSYRFFLSKRTLGLEIWYLFWC